MNYEIASPTSEQMKQCQNCKKNFLIEPEDFSFYQKIGVPPPTFCFDCRLQLRMLWRNERNFYRRGCDLCQKKIISCYPENFKAPVYCQKCWWSDEWDPFSYGQDFDFSKPFFEQYQELAGKVPVLSIWNDDGAGSVNCEYSYDWGYSKNVYLSVCGWYVENGSYLFNVNHCKDIMDCWVAGNSELLYECICCDRCYNCQHCELCFDCNNCLFSSDLKGCSDCVLCFGLRNQKYCIRNQQYSKEDYQAEIARLSLSSRSGRAKLQAEFVELNSKFPKKFAYLPKQLNSTGHFVMEAKNSKNCFYAFSSVENSAYIVINDGAKDSYDCNNTGHAELCYNSVTPDDSHGSRFSIFCRSCTEVEYSDSCQGCLSIFGCSGLKQASYVILNKQYAKDDFFELRSKILSHMQSAGEWGNFFPPEISPFAYNESAAQEWFPLSKETAISSGYRWKDIEKRAYEISKTFDQVPDDLGSIGDDFSSEIIQCLHKGQCNECCPGAFKIVPQELQFYRRLNIPIPVLCPNCRHYTRLAKRNPPKLWHRECMCNGLGSSPRANGHAHNGKCPNQFETSYAPDRPEIVYCEACYNSEIV